MSSLTDIQYHEKVDAVLLEIEERLDEIEEAAGDLDIDYESFGGKLDLTFEDGSKIIINKQEPLHQIWVATKFNGHHFNFEADKGVWIDERFGDEFWHFINDAASKQAGQPVVLNK
ncbi:iron donor protein CyaY [Marinifaba aquimaris]|uniref:iron donor protein CyaY n=1 Tax=Marinifaba aquimaris TaxID=2741323 RepID=UPI001FEC600D|nr:iron donor protein CyaY [Marinifaba aquimaris]